MNQLDRVDLNNILTQALDGKQQIVSYAGTSQYHVQDIGNPGSQRTTISACGLIALNCARTVFRLHKEANLLDTERERDPVDLLQSVLSEQTAEEIISISSSWPSNEHLEIDDIFDIPIFRNSFTVAETFYTQCRISEFSQLLKDTVDTKRDASDPVAVIITRPPEILVCLVMPTSLGSFFVVFDSHPRPLHPSGSGFIINSSLEATSRYLDELLAVDPKLFSDRTIRWQSDLLTHFSGHILVPRENSPSDNLDEILMAAGKTILQLKAEKADSRRRELSHEEDKETLINKIINLERQLEASLDRKGKHKATNYGFWAPFQGDPWSKKTSKSPSVKAGQGSNRGWEDIHRKGAIGGKPLGGKPSYRQGWHKHDDEPSTSHHNEVRDYGMLKPFSIWSTRNHNDPMRTPGIKWNHDTQDRELATALRESKHNEPGRIPGKDLNHVAEDRELATALRESKHSEPGRIPGIDWNHDAQDPELAAALRVSNRDESGKKPGIELNGDAQNGDPSKAPDYSDLDRQMDLDDPSPPPTPPVQVRVDISDVASSNLAMELQRLYDEEDRQLGAERSALKKDSQVDFFDCGICFENLHRDNVAQFASCKHRYCRSCLREHVSSTLEQRRYPIICPECKAKKDPNPAEVEDVLFQSLGPSPEDLRVFYELQLVAHSVTLHCRRCQQTMNVDRGEYQTITIITCPLPGCSHTWCKDCQQAVVLGGPEHSCNGISELKHLMQKKGWRCCPGCEIPIQKIAGCHHMTCSSPGCNTHFCYVCGEKIIKSAGPGVQEAIGIHYRRCQMFDHDTATDSDND
ncbi:hypothetical protein M413DRAFT_442575 [Hebeloma cylindrosporum]|uniref:RING-type domain-containing protein n=1 Tax=Hebeloma cylindrosporum TaxID=76867 RepID=A0A0C3CKJ8_HEBCY|nr:hypothetical protein M413DRAFT_442575 [Hebeloma cylindrosporum h7]